MTTHVALLRGINVGGRAMVPMAELRSLLSTLGLVDVETYIQSGNVVFRSTETDGAELVSRIEAAITESFALTVTVMLRTPAELAELVGRNPFLADEPDLAKLHVVFLDREPSADAVAGLDPDRSPGDRWKVRGREIYLHLPGGAGRTKLTLDYFERRLGVRGTARNWRTVLELLARSRG